VQYEAVIHTPLGPLGLRTDGHALTTIDWLQSAPPVQPRAGLAREAAVALAAWFEEPGELPELPLAPAATAFQERVRRVMQAIPTGCTRTYGDVARELGSVPRAVGGACRGNPLAVVVPCHRIVARTGLGGYSGDWERGAALSHKERLLALEGAIPGRS